MRSASIHSLFQSFFNLDLDLADEISKYFRLFVSIILQSVFKDGDSPGITGLTSFTGLGRGTATVCGTWRTTTTTTAPP